MLEIIASSFVVVTVVALWALVCNERTYRQRIRLIKRRPYGERYWEYSKEYDDVTYAKHMWTLVFFGDARKLYGPLSQEIW